MNAQICTVLSVLALCSASHGNELLVPEEFPTIQSAIDVAEDGDSILVAPGVYQDGIDFLGKAITVRSDVDRDPRTVDLAAELVSLEQGVPIVRFESGEGPDSVLQGVTVDGQGFEPGIRCGSSSPSILSNIVRRCIYGPSLTLVNSEAFVARNVFENNDPGTGRYGGAMRCEFSNPVIENNLFCDNLIWDDPLLCYGAGIACIDSSGVIRGNIFERNRATSSGRGGAVACVRSEMWIEGNRFLNNLAASEWEISGGGAIYAEGSPAPTILGNTLVDNSAYPCNGNFCKDDSKFAYGGALYFVDCDARLINNTILNSAATVGGGIYCEDSEVEIVNCVIWGNEADADPDIGGGAGVVSYSNLSTEWDGEGNLSQDPGYEIDEDGMPYLTSRSPCINRGLNHELLSQDIDGEPRIIQGTIDQGADEYAGTHWLEADSFQLHHTLGGEIHFQLDAGSEHAGRSYVILGSLSGNAPGKSLPAGAHVPLNHDPLTDWFRRAAIFGGPSFSDFVGRLDEEGRAQARLRIQNPFPELFLGKTLTFAMLLVNPADEGSNPINVGVEAPALTLEASTASANIGETVTFTAVWRLARYLCFSRPGSAQRCATADFPADWRRCVSMRQVSGNLISRSVQNTQARSPRFKSRDG